MLATRNRLARNPYFHFHPLHTAFSLPGSAHSVRNGDLVSGGTGTLTIHE